VTSTGIRLVYVNLFGNIMETVSTSETARAREISSLPETITEVYYIHSQTVNIIILLL
jgi:hypothetical protein